MEQAVTFKSDGLTLRGVLGLPEGSEAPRRGAVLVHGWGGYRIGPRRILVHAARGLSARGFATLRFDLRGRGDSDGDGRETSLDDMIADALTAVDFLKERTPVEGVTLIGICSGSNVAIGAATLRPAELRELVLWSVLPFQPEQKGGQRRRRAVFYLWQYFRKALRLETWRRLVRGDVDVKTVGKVIGGSRKAESDGRNLKDSARDIMPAFRSWKGRALFVTGGKDPEGLAGRELFQEFCGQRDIEATFHLVEGATHSYYAREDEREVLDKTLTWLAAPFSATTQSSEGRT